MCLGKSSTLADKEEVVNPDEVRDLCHDLRSPLVSAVSEIDLLLLNKEAFSFSDLQQRLEDTRAHLIALSSYATSVLDNWRERNRGLRIANCDLNDLIEGAVKIVRPRSSIIVHYEGKLPTLRSNKIILEQMFVNILSNACSAMGTQGGKITISVSTNESVCDLAFENPVYQVFEPGYGLGFRIISNAAKLLGVSFSTDATRATHFRFILHFPPSSLVV